jgi:hypothetical protein
VNFGNCYTFNKAVPVEGVSKSGPAYGKMTLFESCGSLHHLKYFTFIPYTAFFRYNYKRSNQGTSKRDSLQSHTNNVFFVSDQ